MNFKQELTKYQQIVNEELKKHLRKEDVPEQILNNSMEYSLMAGGKRLRPILVIATYEIFNTDIKKCMPYAVAIEMVHNFSLIHDDLPAIDNDDFRHGKPTNHKAFNEPTAILAGDGLLNQAYMVISDDLKNSNLEELKEKTAVFKEFSYSVDRMIAGEYIHTEYEGKQITAAVTEEITVQDENKFDIDLGIVEDPKFDLKLDKIVGSITVNTSKATTEHEYNKNFAKIDFESKYADSSTMVVEYKIIVTNEGAIPGYVKKIADYLPNEMKFSTELNQDWYEGKDGTIYNIALANTIINPGESKEVKLVLTKNMTKESFGLITNKAEIYEASNDYGINDMDSTPGNQSTNEDDYSIANVLTGVKTGEAVIYTTLIITIIAIIGVGTYIIKKRVIK